MAKLRRALAIWARFKGFLSSQQKVVAKGHITNQELQQGERAALTWLQREHWMEGRQKQEDGQALRVTKNSVLYQLSPVWDAGLICMDARTRERVPIVPKGHFSKLLVREAHEKQGHLGREATASEASKKFWIIGLKQQTRRAVKTCVRCRQWKAKPGVQQMAPLPKVCMQSMEKAFEVTGVDYFGPFHAKPNKSTKTVQKMYGVLFTCTTTRAVHLEIAPDLTSSGFINALRRFTARRGHVKQLISDNGTNLVGSDGQLKEELKTELAQLTNQPEAVLAETRAKGIDWRFNAPGASHHGGFWERLIRTTRRVLQTMLPKTAKPTLDTLTTALYECEAILNNQPLTAVSEDPNDFNALTPNHLLIGCANGRAPPGNFDSMASHLRHRWKNVQHVIQRFWKRWCQEYLVLLRQRAKWHRSKGPQVKIGDVVLVIDPLRPRNYWKMGRVVETHHNEVDDRVRVAEVKTADGIITRPINKLCLLEANE